MARHHTYPHPSVIPATEERDVFGGLVSRIDDSPATGHAMAGVQGRELTTLAVSATVHCLTGCAIGEILGMVLATWWGWHDAASIGLAVALAFVFGYSLTMAPVLRSGLPLRRAVRVALAADTLSILTMEIVDNLILFGIPNAMAAGLTDLLFWGSLAASLTVAFVVTVPINRALIARGRGHAVVHGYHRPAPSRGGLLTWVRRHPYLVFLVIFNTFGQALAFIPVIARKAYGVEVDTELFLILPTLLFLLLPALVITRLARGGGALRDLIRSMVRVRVTGWWYVLPLLAVPALTLVASLPAPPDLTGDRVLQAYVTAYLPALLFQFVTTNWWEETVWMGFFQGPLQQRFGPWRAVLLTAPFFALEHVSLVFGGSVSEGITLFVLIVLVTVPTRALLAWVYNRTASLALVGLIHAASNAAGLGLVTQLWHQPGSGGLALLLLGIGVIALTRGRLGWRRTTTAPAGSGPAMLRPASGPLTRRPLQVAGDNSRRESHR